jgi:hypothetical protein
MNEKWPGMPTRSLQGESYRRPGRETGVPVESRSGAAGCRGGIGRAYPLAAPFGRRRLTGPRGCNEHYFYRM